MDQSDFEDALDLLNSTDVKQRLSGINLGPRLVNFVLESPEEENILPPLVEILTKLILDNNFRISQCSLENLLTLLVTIPHFRNTYLPSILPNVLEKMGDSKPRVIEAVLRFLSTAMFHEETSPTFLFDKIKPVFSYKNWRARHTALVFLTESLAKHSKMIKPIIFIKQAVTLLEDQNNNVRSQAIAVLEEIYRCEGNTVRAKLEEYNIRPALLNLVYEKLDAIEPLTGSSSTLRSSSDSLGSRGSTPTSGSTLGGSGKLSSSGKIILPGQGKKSHRNSPVRRSQEKTDLKPSYFSTERELITAFDGIARNLANTTDDWEERMEAMTFLKRILLGGAHEQFPNFVSLLLTKLRTPLSTQLLDLRSVVSKEAGAMIIALSQELGEAFEPLADHFAEVLLQVVKQTNHVLADGGNETMLAMLEHTGLNRQGLRRILETCASRSTILRQRSLQYILIMLNDIHKNPGIVKLRKEVGKIIKNALSDSDGQTRKNARQAFWAYEANYPEVGKTILQSLEPNIKKVLLTERDEVSNTSQKSLSMQSVRLPPSGIKSKPRNKLIQPITRKAYSLSSLNTEAERALSDLQQNSSVNTSVQPKKAQRVTKADSDSGVLTHPPSRVELSQPPVRVELKKKKAELNKKTVVRNDSQTRPPKKLSTTHPNTTIPGLLLNVNSNNWIHRLQTFSGIRDYALSTSQNEVRANFDSIMQAFESHLDDPHFKVLHSVLEALVAIVSEPSFSSRFAGYLEKLLPLIFHILGSSKEENKYLGSHLLELLFSLYDSDFYIPLVIRVIDLPTSTQKTKIGVIEYIIHYLPQLVSFFHTVSHTKHTLARLHKMATDTRNNELRKASLHLINEMYASTGKQSFFGALTTFDHGIQQALIKAMSSTFPAIQQDFKLFSHLNQEENHQFLTDKLTDELIVESGDDLVVIDTKMKPTNYALEKQKQKEKEKEMQKEKEKEKEKGKERERVRVKENSYQNPSSLYAILSSLKKPGSNKKDGLFDLSTYLRNNPTANTQAPSWKEDFGAIFLLILDVLEDSDYHIRELALYLLKDIIKLYPTYIDEYMNVAIISVLNRCSDKEQSVERAAAMTLDACVHFFSPYKLFEVFLTSLQRESSPKIIETILRAIVPLVSLLKLDELRNLLSITLPTLILAFSNPSTGVRKEVVFAIVEIYLKLGDEFTPYLTELSPSQKKLVNIYLSRQKKKRSEN